MKQMGKDSIYRCILSASFLLALQPLFFIWFNHGGEKAQSGFAFLPGAVFFAFIWVYYIGLWSFRAHPAKVQVAIHAVWLAVYAGIFANFSMRMSLREGIQDVQPGFFIAVAAIVMHLMFALACRRLLLNRRGKESAGNFIAE